MFNMDWINIDDFFISVMFFMDWININDFFISVMFFILLIIFINNIFNFDPLVELLGWWNARLYAYIIKMLKAEYDKKNNDKKDENNDKKDENNDNKKDENNNKKKWK